MADAATLPPSDAAPSDVTADEANAVRPAPDPDDIQPIAIKDTALLGALYEAGPEPELAMALAQGLGRYDAKKKRYRSDLVRRSLKGFAEQGLVILSHEGEGAALTLKGRLIWEALTGQTAEPGPGGAFGVAHALIDPDPDNARQTFDDEDLVGLADDIAERGLLQNITLRTHPDDPSRFMLVAGERRWRAVGELIRSGRWPAHKPIPAVVRDYAGEAEDVTFEAAIDALVENLVRVQLSPLEEARAFKRLTGEGLSTAALAARIKKTQRFVQQRLKLLDLTAEDQAALEAGELTVEAARAKLAEPRTGEAGDHLPPPTSKQPSARLPVIGDPFDQETWDAKIKAAANRWDFRRTGLTPADAAFWVDLFFSASCYDLTSRSADHMSNEAFQAILAERLPGASAEAGRRRGVEKGWICCTHTGKHAPYWTLYDRTRAAAHSAAELARREAGEPAAPTLPAQPDPDDNATLIRRARQKVLDALEDLNRVVVTELTDPHAHNQTLANLEKDADALQAAAEREGAR